MNEITRKIQEQVNNVILGKEDVVRKVLIAILAQGHVLLEDVPGVGKTTMAKAFARTLGLSTKRIQFTPDTLPSDITGFSIYDRNSESFKYQPGAVMTNFLLADEINRTSSKTQAALLEAMEEEQVTVDGNTIKLPMPFIVLATQNPVGSAGTQRLPESQLDRFLIHLKIGYPDIISQTLLMKERHHENPVDKVKAVISAEELIEISNEAMNTYISDPLYQYIAEIADATRNDKDIVLGLSPRGALALCRAVKANAYIEGREYAVTEDVLAVVNDVAVHRLVISSKARLHEKTTEDILNDILSRIRKPDLKDLRNFK